MKITKTVVRKLLKIVDCGLISGAGDAAVPGQVCVEQAVTMALGEPLSDQPKCVSNVLRRFKIKLNDSNWSSNGARAKGMRRLAIAQLGTKDTLDEKEFVKRLAEMTIRHSIPEAFDLVAKKTTNAEWKAQIIKASENCKKLGTCQSACDARDEMRAYRSHLYAAAYADAAAYAATDAAAYAATDAAAAAAYADAAAYAATDAAAYAAAYAAAAYVDAAAYTAAAAAAYAAAYAAAAYADAAAAAYTAAAAAAAAYADKKRDQSLTRYAEKVVQILIDMNTPGSKFLSLTEE